MDICLYARQGTTEKFFSGRIEPEFIKDKKEAENMLDSIPIAKKEEPKAPEINLNPNPNNPPF